LTEENENIKARRERGGIVGDNVVKKNDAPERVGQAVDES
jgi:hypothetical protein